MERQIIDVDFDDGYTSIARILRDVPSEYEIALLEYYGGGEWNFDTEETISISKDCVSGFYDTMKLESTGLYEKLINGMYVEKDGILNCYITARMIVPKRKYLHALHHLVH